MTCVAGGEWCLYPTSSLVKDELGDVSCMHGCVLDHVAWWDSVGQFVKKVINAAVARQALKELKHYTEKQRKLGLECGPE